MKIQVYGTGCAPCKVMLANTQAAARQLGLTDAVQHVSRIQDMLEAGITGTPALAINGEIKVMGQALDVPAIVALLQQA
jgi:small redox-active disulfide protein 2